MIIHKNFSLKNKNTFNLPATAKFLAEIYSVEDFHELREAQFFRENENLILGGGSNILFKNDFDGIVILNRIGGIKVTELDDQYVQVSAGGGVIWDDLVTFCVDQNFGGIENLALIPGTVGAAPIQNIGAYGIELKETFQSLSAISIKEGEEIRFTKNDCEFGYRNSVFKNKLKGLFFISEVTLTLSKNPVINMSYASIKDEIEKSGTSELSVKFISELVKKIRRSKLPDPKVLGNGGSFFKNPEIGKDVLQKLQEKYSSIPSYPINENLFKIPAGWLIEQCGLKGCRKGNVGTYHNQALVIVNYGGAEGKEIVEFADFVKSKVLDKFGIELTTEVNII